MPCFDPVMTLLQCRCPGHRAVNGGGEATTRSGCGRDWRCRASPSRTSRDGARGEANSRPRLQPLGSSLDARPVADRWSSWLDATIEQIEERSLDRIALRFQMTVSKTLTPYEAIPLH